MRRYTWLILIVAAIAAAAAEEMARSPEEAR